VKPVVAMPRHRRGQKLAFFLDEDDVTLAWDAVRKAALPPGTRVAASGLDLPPWWWQGTQLASDAAAPLALRPVPTTVGPSVVLHGAGAVPDVEGEAAAIHGAAPTMPEADWQKVRLARDGPDGEADYPLGAYVAQARHDEVTAQRMRLPAGTIESWTAIGPGAAPTEFLRLQDAVGAYAVALVRFPDGARSVGLWASRTPPRVGDAAEPVLRRLFRTQGAWRYGIKFEPRSA
jgi:uncharacterized OB-fold protein